MYKTITKTAYRKRFYKKRQASPTESARVERRSLETGLRGDRLASLSGGSWVETSRPIRTPRESNHAWRKTIRVLDLPPEHRASHRAALLTGHLLPPLDPRASRGGQAAVRGIVRPPATRLGAQAALADPRRHPRERRLALGARARSRAAPGTGARRHRRTQVIGPGAGGAELVAGA